MLSVLGLVCFVLGPQWRYHYHCLLTWFRVLSQCGRPHVCICMFSSHSTKVNSSPVLNSLLFIDSLRLGFIDIHWWQRFHVSGDLAKIVSAAVHFIARKSATGLRKSRSTWMHWGCLGTMDHLQSIVSRFAAAAMRSAASCLLNKSHYFEMNMPCIAAWLVHTSLMNFAQKIQNES